MFEPRVALASLSGESDAAWAQQGVPYAGAAFLGGIAIDARTRNAAREMRTRDREEFLPPNPISFIERELRALSETPIRAGFNVRTATLDPLRQASERCARHNAFVEINAHCRQAEMCAAGAGEGLLADADRLCEQVRVAANTGAPVSVKVRAETGVSLPNLATKIEDAGASMIHVDAMDSESVIQAIADQTELFVIANNEVRDRESVEEYLAYGADAVSVGRPSTNPQILQRVSELTDQWFTPKL